MWNSSIKRLCTIFLLLLCFSGHGTAAYASPAKTVVSDSSAVRLRTLPEEKKKELAGDSDYRYDRTPPAPKTFWERFMRWLGRLFSKMPKSKSGAMTGLSMLEYAFIIAAVVIVILLIFRSNIQGAFRGSSASIPIAFSATEEDIHRVNFDELIAEAEARRDFRKAVRLHFLKLLKQLSDRNLITWQAGKTNSDYTIELSKSSYSKQFSELAYLYEYIWYGDFSITESSYSSLTGKFKNFKTA